MATKWDSASLCVCICGSWGYLIGVWISYFSEAAAHLKKNELGGLEAMQYGYNFTYSFRNN